MLIGLAGRKCSGKSTLSQLLVEKGFQRASFAAALKEYVAKLYCWPVDKLYSQDGKEELIEPVNWNEDVCNRLSDLVSMSLPFCGVRQFFRRREALQYIGTDVLRKADSDFHVNEFKKRFCDGNFVCDDLRFPNELNIFQEMNGVCVYVTRPYCWDYSNHSSEISLSRKDFKYICLNDRSLHKLLRKSGMFFSHLLCPDSKIDLTREQLIAFLTKHGGDTHKCAENLCCSRDKVIWWATNYMVNIARNHYSVKDDVFLSPTPESAYWAGVLSADGCVKKHLKYDYLLELTSNDSCLVEDFAKFLGTNKPIDKRLRPNGKTKHTLAVSSPWLIDDLKLWCVEPKKSTRNKVPDIIRYNDDLLSYWLVGLIDGDGSIYLVTQSRDIGITILASLEIINFVEDWLKIPCCKVQEKKIDNLWNLKYSGKNAVSLYKAIYKGVGLSRKWDKVKPFLDRK